MCGQYAGKKNPSAITCTKCNLESFCSRSCYEVAMREYHPALCTANREAYRKLIKVVSTGTTNSSRTVLLATKAVAMMIHKKYDSIFD